MFAILAGLRLGSHSESEHLKKEARLTATLPFCLCKKDVATYASYHFVVN